MREIGEVGGERAEAVVLNPTHTLTASHEGQHTKSIINFHCGGRCSFDVNYNKTKEIKIIIRISLPEFWRLHDITSLPVGNLVQNVRIGNTADV